MSQFIFAILNSGAINEVYGYLVAGIIFFIPFQLYRTGKIYVNMLNKSSFIVLMFFGLTYSLIGGDFKYIEYYVVCPLLAFSMGWIVVEYSKIDRAKFIKNAIYAICIGYSSHSILNLITNMGSARWELIDFYTGSIRTATGSGVLITILFSLVVFVFVLEESKIIKIVTGLLAIISLLYAFMLGNRTQIIILIVVNIVVFVLYFHELAELRGKLKYICILTIIIMGGAYIVVTNKFGIQDVFWSSNLAGRFLDTATESSDSYRLSRYSLGLRNLLDHPLGGLASERYYHNMWLDIGRISGVIPFAIMVLYTIITNRHMLKIFNSKANPVFLRYLLLAVYLGVQLNFFVEPILEGVNEFFLCFCLINGMVEGYYYYEHRRNEIINCREVIL